MRNTIKLLAVICSLFLITNCDQEVSNTSQKEESLIVTFEDSLSYALGITIAENVQSDNVGREFSEELLIEGLRDYFTKNEPRLDQEDRKNILRELNAQNAKREAEQRKAIGKEAKELARMNKILGKEFLDNNKTKEGVLVRYRSQLQYKKIVTGSGKIPDYDDKVTVHYNGYLIDGHKFDSSYDKGKPLTLEVSRFVPGFQEALMMMPVGSRWEVYIPYNLAYGEAGIPGRNEGEFVVPPASVLIFEMELLEIIE